MRAHQVLVSASPGDAVSDAVLALRPALRTLGESEVFARYYDASLTGDVLPLDEYARRVPSSGASADDVLIVHASIGEPAVADFLAERSERLVLLYHNISPADPFRPYDPVFANLLEEGRREVAALRPRVAMAMADSAFNAHDLESMGYADVRVNPLVVDAPALCRVRPDPPTDHHLATMIDGPLLLFVGQLLPHKRPDLLVQAFHVLTTYHRPDARLVLVGPRRLRRYARGLQYYVEELGLPGAWIAGPVTREALAAFYRRADVFVTASEHEGFCVPLLEAMAFGVPVLARSFGAVPETAGDAALLLPPDDDPLLLAEGMAALLDDDDLRASLEAAGQRRLEQFEPARSTATFLRHLAELD